MNESSKMRQEVPDFLVNVLDFYRIGCAAARQSKGSNSYHMQITWSWVFMHICSPAPLPAESHDA